MVPIIETVGISDRRELLDMLATAFRDDNPAHPEFDFLYPDLFADTAMGCHRIIRQDGRIVACVGCYPQTLRLGPVTVEMFGIGQVSCLKAYRERGFMTALLKDAVARMEATSAAMSWLGGRRDRYAHFGWEIAGTGVRCRLSRKALRSTGVPPVSRMGVSPMPTFPVGETCHSRPDQHGLEARATHGRDAHAAFDFTPHTPADISDELWALYQAGAVRCVYPKDEWLRKLARGGPQTIWTATERTAAATTTATETAPAAFAVTSPGADTVHECGGEFGALRTLLTAIAERGGHGGLWLSCCPGVTEFADFFWTHAEWVSPELLNLRVHHLERLLEAYRPIWGPHVPHGANATLIMRRNGTEQRFTFGEGRNVTRASCPRDRSCAGGTCLSPSTDAGGTPLPHVEELCLDELQMVRLLFGPWPPSMLVNLPPSLQWLGQIFPLPFAVPGPSHV